ncbi:MULTISPECIES: hypothetical protein [unclassified Dysgonomonas]|jgi:uncharacterized membrane protein HdeD (DUF308 family)|uniref:hypothetical protein n=1 Tax=unclassified Dysgonomonas TaxID=2630389 RepID=UPI0025C35685|nr:MULTISPECIES: hypothetical protein [unclassified Dysgonomonas]MDR2004573.1 hypothetical protein [Prevotella sp.]HMM02084.1 hypothetical protein [Dysgonomonas sp.]
MDKLNRYISFELLFALLFIIAFSLPWLDMGLVKIVGWDIPDIQKKVTKVTNFFSRNKESVYTTYVVYLVPLLSIFSAVSWLSLKKKSARVLLMIAGILAFVVSLNLFYKLPKYGSGVYLLCATSILSVVYLIIIFRKKKVKPVIDDNNLFDNPGSENIQSL